MAYIRSLVIFSFVIFCMPSYSGYAQLVPPAAFTAATSISPAMFNGAAAAAANEATWLAGTVRTNAALNVAGNLVKMPVTMRLAANAPSFLAARIGAGLAGGPAGLLVTGLTVGACLALPAVLDWISKADKDIVVDDQGHFFSTVKTSKTIFTDIYGQGSYNDAMSACSVNKPYYVGSDGINLVLAGEDPNYIYYYCDCPVCGGALGSIRGAKSKGADDIRKLDYANDVQPLLSKTPFPDDLPAKLPIPLPVQAPIINPSPDSVPVPQPMIVPSGDPVPVPNTSPQRYIQPSVQITPSPLITDPWRVDVTPTNVPTTDPNGLTSPVTVPVTSTSTATASNPSSTPADIPDLCALHPDILACKNLDEVADTDLRSKDISIQVTPAAGWGSSSATCPPARHVTVMGRDVPVSFDLFCKFAEIIRPAILAVAWLSAALLLVGGVKQE